MIPPYARLQLVVGINLTGWAHPLFYSYVIQSSFVTQPDIRIKEDEMKLNRKLTSLTVNVDDAISKLKMELDAVTGECPVPTCGYVMFSDLLLFDDVL